MVKRLTLWILLGLVLACLAITYAAKITPKPRIVLPLFFFYSPASLTYLDKFEASGEITLKELQDWDDIIYDLVRKHQLNDIEAAKVYAYVYAAQRDAAFIAFNLKQKFAGNINSVSTQTLCLFFPGDCSSLKTETEEDTFASQLGALIAIKINEQLKSEIKQQHSYSVRSGPQFWQGKIPYEGFNTASWKTWLIQSTDKFRIPPPSFKGQIELVAKARQDATDAQKKLIVKWAAGPGTITLPGEWLKLATDYFIDTKLSLTDIILKRSILAISMRDTLIAAYHEKYTYWTKRPYMLAPELNTIIPTPNSPSYPSSHAAISCAAAQLLSHFSPKNKTQWDNLAQQAKNIGIWSGIQFPNDINGGCQLGTSIANAIIKSARAGK